MRISREYAEVTNVRFQAKNEVFMSSEKNKVNLKGLESEIFTIFQDSRIRQTRFLQSRKTEFVIDNKIRME